MKPLAFQQVNRVLIAPPGMKDCGELPIFATTDQHGYPLLISKWQMTIDEFEALKKNKVLFMGVTAQNQPPIWITPVDPMMEPTADKTAMVNDSIKDAKKHAIREMVVSELAPKGFKQFIVGSNTRVVNSAYIYEGQIEKLVQRLFDLI